MQQRLLIPFPSLHKSVRLVVTTSFVFFFLPPSYYPFLLHYIIAIFFLLLFLLLYFIYPVHSSLLWSSGPRRCLGKICTLYQITRRHDTKFVCILADNLIYILLCLLLILLLFNLWLPSHIFLSVILGYHPYVARPHLSIAFCLSLLLLLLLLLLLFAFLL